MTAEGMAIPPEALNIRKPSLSNPDLLPSRKTEAFRFWTLYIANELDHFGARCSSAVQTVVSRMRQ
jgi:hypothetical protein